MQTALVAAKVIADGNATDTNSTANVTVPEPEPITIIVHYNYSEFEQMITNITAEIESVNKQIIEVKEAQTLRAAQYLADSQVVVEKDPLEGWIGVIAGGAGILIALITLIVACVYCCKNKKAEAQLVQDPVIEASDECSDEEKTPGE